MLIAPTHPQMRPAHDPLRSLVCCAAERAVRDVFVDGVQPVADREVLTIDYAAAAAEPEEAQKRAVKEIPSSIGLAAGPTKSRRRHDRRRRDPTPRVDTRRCAAYSCGTCRYATGVACQPASFLDQYRS